MIDDEGMRRAAERLRQPARHPGKDERTTELAKAETSASSAATLELHEEQFQAQKKSVQTGEVEVGKRLVTETRTFEVAVTHEELVINRNPGERDTTARLVELQPGETIRLVLMGEEVVIEKRPVVIEEVTIGKNPVTETRTFDDMVRREEPVIRGADAATTAGRSESRAAGAARASAAAGETLHQHRYADGKCLECGHTP